MGSRLNAVREDILNSVAAGDSPRLVAGKLQLRPSYVRRVISVARQLGDGRVSLVKPRTKPMNGRAFWVTLPILAHRRLAAAAEQRGLNESELTSLLIETLTNDNLLDAALDDAE